MHPAPTIESGVKNDPNGRRGMTPNGPVGALVTDPATDAKVTVIDHVTPVRAVPIAIGLQVHELTVRHRAAATEAGKTGGAVTTATMTAAGMAVAATNAARTTTVEVVNADVTTVTLAENAVATASGHTIAGHASVPTIVVRTTVIAGRLRGVTRTMIDGRRRVATVTTAGDGTTGTVRAVTGTVRMGVVTSVMEPVLLGDPVGQMIDSTLVPSAAANVGMTARATRDGMAATIDADHAGMPVLAVSPMGIRAAETALAAVAAKATATVGVVGRSATTGASTAGVLSEAPTTEDVRAASVDSTAIAARETPGLTTTGSVEPSTMVGAKAAGNRATVEEVVHRTPVTIGIRHGLRAGSAAAGSTATRTVDHRVTRGLVGRTVVQIGAATTTAAPQSVMSDSQHVRVADIP